MRLIPTPIAISWHKVVNDRMTDKSFNEFVTILCNPIQKHYIF